MSDAPAVVAVPSDRPRRLRGLGAIRRLVTKQWRRAFPPPPSQAFQERLNAQVRRAHWDGTTLVLEGFAYLWGLADQDVTISIVARRPGRRPVPFVVRMGESSEVDTLVDDPHESHGASAFVASIDAARLGRRESSWQVEVVARHHPWQATARGPFTYLYRWGTAGHVKALRLGSSAFATVRWESDSGMHLDVTRPAAVLEETARDGEGLVARVSLRRGVRPSAARVGASVEVPIESIGGREHRIRLDPSCPVGRHGLAVLGFDGTAHPVWAGAIEGTSPVSLEHVQLMLDASGPVAVDHRESRVVVTAVEAEVRDDLPVVVVTGLHRGVDVRGVTMAGPRVDLEPLDVQVDGEQFVVVFPLWMLGPWADRPSALLLGGYGLAVPGDVPARVAPDLLATLYRRVQVGPLRLRIEADPEGRLHLNMTRPRRDSEIGKHNRRLLREAYVASSPQPREAVLFEAFSGRTASDNTLPLSRELLARRPDLEAFWSITDYSVVVPEGIEPVLRYSSEWFDLLGSARFIVTNSWLPGRFVRRPHQRVLQAWHGTPFKRMGLDRIGRSHELDEEKGEGSLAVQASMWSLLLAQNQFSEDVFRRAYRFEGEVAQTGYPRNDVLVSSDRSELAARTRAKLGIRAGQRVVLYMPTWREDSKQIFAELDLAAVAESLGPDGVVLVRGHTNTLGRGRRVGGGSVVDVTVYPEVSDLFLVTDVLITDYSSVMFDFTVTGRPIIFFTPDLEKYTTTLRGAYFDLAETAPGPLVSTTEEVVAVLADVDHVHAEHAGRYRDWQQRYNPHEDGHATQRAIDALLRDR